jgi:hypothetical protein
VEPPDVPPFIEPLDPPLMSVPPLLSFVAPLLPPPVPPPGAEMFIACNVASSSMPVACMLFFCWKRITLRRVCGP